MWDLIFLFDKSPGPSFDLDELPVSSSQSWFCDNAATISAHSPKSMHWKIFIQAICHFFFLFVYVAANSLPDCTNHKQIHWSKTINTDPSWSYLYRLRSTNNNPDHLPVQYVRDTGIRRHTPLYVYPLVSFWFKKDEKKWVYGRHTGKIRDEIRSERKMWMGAAGEEEDPGRRKMAMVAACCRPLPFSHSAAWAWLLPENAGSWRWL